MVQGDGDQSDTPITEESCDGDNNEVACRMEADYAADVQADTVEEETVQEVHASPQTPQTPPPLLECDLATVNEPPQIKTEPIYVEDEPHESGNGTSFSLQRDRAINVYTCTKHGNYFGYSEGALLIIAKTNDDALKCVRRWERDNGFSSDGTPCIRQIHPYDKGVMILCHKPKGHDICITPRTSCHALTIDELSIFVYKDVLATFPDISGAIVFAPKLHTAKKILRAVFESKYPKDYKGCPDKTDISTKLVPLDLPENSLRTGVVVPLSVTMMGV
jgi:hypothetical protein